ncbi:MAG TPA: EamA family transporter, partial [Ktedonobacterales bacterium]|nr:EamA family transporter [Ktedonobacterales bacterium]
VANGALFILYVVLGHRIANAQPSLGSSKDGTPTAQTRREVTGIDRLGASMLVASLAISPIGLGAAAPAFTHPELLLAGIGVGLCSSVIPYVTDQLAMARLPRATFALLLSLLPACAAIIGLIVLHQIPTFTEAAGIVLVMVGVAVHREAEAG